jgi:hypothetical protein
MFRSWAFHYLNFLLQIMSTPIPVRHTSGPFYYSNVDCEDRSVLFAWLVEHSFGQEVIGLNSPNYVATAVRLDTSLDKGRTT